MEMEKFDRVTLNVLGAMLMNRTSDIESMSQTKGKNGEEKLHAFVTENIKEIINDQILNANEINSYILNMVTNRDKGHLSDLKRNLRSQYKQLGIIQNNIKKRRKLTPKHTSYAVIKSRDLQESPDKKIDIRESISNSQRGVVNVNNIDSLLQNKSLEEPEPEPEYLELQDIFLNVRGSILEDSVEENHNVNQAELARAFNNNKSKKSWLAAVTRTCQIDFAASQTIAFRKILRASLI